MKTLLHNQLCKYNEKNIHYLLLNHYQHGINWKGKIEFHVIIDQRLHWSWPPVTIPRLCLAIDSRTGSLVFFSDEALFWDINIPELTHFNNDLFDRTNWKEMDYWRIEDCFVPEPPPKITFLTKMKNIICKFWKTK